MFTFPPPFSAILLSLLSQFSRKERDSCPREWDRTMFQLPFPSFVTLMTLSLSFFFCKIGMTIFTLLWGLIEHIWNSQYRAGNATTTHWKLFYIPASFLPPHLSILCLILYLLSIEKCGLTTSHLLSTMLGTEEKMVLMGNKSLPSSAYHLWETNIDQSRI